MRGAPTPHPGRAPRRPRGPARGLLVVLVVMAALAALVGCGGGDESGRPATTAGDEDTQPSATAGDGGETRPSAATGDDGVAELAGTSVDSCMVDYSGIDFATSDAEVVASVEEVEAACADLEEEYPDLGAVTDAFVARPAASADDEAKATLYRDQTAELASVTYFAGGDCEGAFQVPDDPEELPEQMGSCRIAAVGHLVDQVLPGRFATGFGELFSSDADPAEPTEVDGLDAVIGPAFGAAVGTDRAWVVYADDSEAALTQLVRATR